MAGTPCSGANVGVVDATGPATGAPTGTGAGPGTTTGSPGQTNNLSPVGSIRGPWDVAQPFSASAQQTAIAPQTLRHGPFLGINAKFFLAGRFSANPAKKGQPTFHTIGLKTHCAAEHMPTNGHVGSARAMNQPVKIYRLARSV